jgi:hypothetical protein
VDTPTVGKTDKKIRKVPVGLLTTYKYKELLRLIQ